MSKHEKPFENGQFARFKQPCWGSIVDQTEKGMVKTTTFTLQKRFPYYVIKVYKNYIFDIEAGIWFWVADLQPLTPTEKENRNLCAVPCTELELAEDLTAHI